MSNFSHLGKGKMKSLARRAKNRQNFLPKTLFGAIISTSLIVPLGASASGITNGTFETGNSGDTSIGGWTTVNTRIDLGVDSIAGCATVDTSDYTTLRDFTTRWDSITNAASKPPSRDPSVNNDSLTLSISSGPTFTSRLLSGSSTDIGSTYRRSGQVLNLASRMTANPAGFVFHGPAIYSEPFTAKTIDDLKLDWAAEAKSDDYKVFGYLLNTSTCSQTEVIDSTGAASDWQTVTVAIPTNATYRFVFVGGTFDKTMGTVAGADLYLDNIVLTVNQERAAEEQRNSSPESPKIPRINEFEFDKVFITPGKTLTLTGARLHCTTYVNISSQAASFSFSVLPGGLGQFAIAVPANLQPGHHSMNIDSCGGPVTYRNMLVVSKPPVMKEGRFSSAMEQGETVKEIRRWVLEHRSDYNSVQCISNTNVGAQERARQFATDICRQVLGLLASPKGSEVEVRDKSTHIAVWYRLFLINQ